MDTVDCIGYGVLVVLVAVVYIVFDLRLVYEIKRNMLYYYWNGG